MTSSTVTDCLSSLFCFLGFPGCIHSDRGAPFVSCETRSFLTERGIAFSTSTPYHPEGNSQCERVNQTMWRTIKLFLHGKRLPEERWESVLLEALHAIRSLVCLLTNETPPERLFRFSRKAMFGAALPSWLLSPGTVCDGFVSMPPLISLITCRSELHCLITCRVELHCFAWSFVSHVDVRWLLVSYQAFVVLRCRC